MALAGVFVTLWALALVFNENPKICIFVFDYLKSFEHYVMHTRHFSTHTCILKTVLKYLSVE